MPTTTEQKQRRRAAAAKRALAEAAARREQHTHEHLTSERGGPRGAEPTRFGDWERKGIASDF